MEINNKNKEKNEQFSEAWKMLEDKGFTIGERMKIRKTFAEWGKEMLTDVKKEDNYYLSTLEDNPFKHYGFKEEKDVILMNSLYKFAPNTDKEKLMKVFSLISTLLNVDSGYNF
jgi:hypothetical protein